MDSSLIKLSQALQTAVNGMTPEQLLWHPGEKWCAAEILEHLYLSYTGTIKGFEKVILAGRSLATTASIKQRYQTLFVLTFNYLPTGRTAPTNTRPKGLPLEEVRSMVASKIEEMDAVIEQCAERFGRSKKLLDHPILGPLTAAQWRKFHLIHGLHHQKQIFRLRESSANS
jgi:hypothetical protein